MTERKLATIRVINEVLDIQNADNIQLAIIDGWSVVVKKNEFEAGSFCIYVEIDSVLPEKPEFEFLRSKKFKVKTMKLNKFGVISQGICFPVSILPHSEYSIGDDVTEILGIKYDDEDIKEEKKKQNWWFRFKIIRSLFLRKSRQNEFPDWISKTNEPRIENNIYLLNNKIPYIVTEKLDGCSVTYAMKKTKTWRGNKFEFIVCSRKRQVYENDKEKQYWAPVYKYDLKKRMKDYLEIHSSKLTAVCIQGELVGPKIQKNKYKLNEVDLYVFNIFIFQWHNSWDFDKFIIRYEEQEGFCEVFGVKRVPLIANDFVLPDTINDLRKFVNRPSTLNDKVMIEGGVFRDYEYKISFKCVNPEFLIKFEE